MAEIIVTLSDDANTSLIRKMIENIKGVMATTLNNRQEETESEKKIKKLHNLINRMDTSVIDRNDERTRYILSK
ncbi:MAG: hypothetical protein J1F07_05495 [Muribaculaceae bacterium]|nr:hypothetical protein [Muribaculaceae bacterium]